MSINFTVSGTSTSLNFANGRAAILHEIMGLGSSAEGEVKGVALRGVRRRLLQ